MLAGGALREIPRSGIFSKLSGAVSLLDNSLPAILHEITHLLNSSRIFISSRGTGQEIFWDGDPNPIPQEPSSGHRVIQVRPRDP